jgi:hypothetical protein
VIGVWTIRGLPELQGLAPEERERVAAAAGAGRATLRLWLRAAALGAIIATLIVAGLRPTGLLGGASWAGLLAFALTWTLAAAVAFRVQLIMVRSQIRLAIMRASAGGRVPVCLGCGHDVSGIESDRCPECDASLRVPAGGP